MYPLTLFTELDSPKFNTFPFELAAGGLVFPVLFNGVLVEVDSGAFEPDNLIALTRAEPERELVKFVFSDSEKLELQS